MGLGAETNYRSSKLPLIELMRGKIEINPRNLPYYVYPMVKYICQDPILLDTKNGLY